MEDKVAGQVGATKVFWAYLKRSDLEDSFKKHMPLEYGFAKRSFERTMVRDASKKPKKANLDEVLLSVKGIRDVFSHRDFYGTATARISRCLCLVRAYL